MIQFSNYEDCVDRQDRLVETYQSLAKPVRVVVTGMHDHKGLLTVEVSKIVPWLKRHIEEAWLKHGEYSFKILHEGRTIYDSTSSHFYAEASK